MKDVESLHFKVDADCCFVILVEHFLAESTASRSVSASAMTGKCTASNLLTRHDFPTETLPSTIAFEIFRPAEVELLAHSSRISRGKSRISYGVHPLAYGDSIRFICRSSGAASNSICSNIESARIIKGCVKWEGSVFRTLAVDRPLLRIHSSSPPERTLRYFRKFPRTLFDRHYPKPRSRRLFWLHLFGVTLVTVTSGALLTVTKTALSNHPSPRSCDAITQ